MNRLVRACLPALTIGLMTVFAAAQNTPPAGAPPMGAPPAGGPAGAFAPKNLKVLPQDTDLRKVMREYAGQLGVTCEFCHAAADPVTHRSDRASDANPLKDTARFMISMTGDLNAKLDELPNKRYADPVTCGTCHRGEKHPSVFVPPPPGGRPPGAPAAVDPAAAAPPVPAH